MYIIIHIYMCIYDIGLINYLRCTWLEIGVSTGPGGTIIYGGVRTSFDWLRGSGKNVEMPQARASAADPPLFLLP